MEVKKRG